LKIDNEFKSLIPPLTDEERGELEKSILAEGCRDALVLWGDTLVDGHNRAEICERHGIPYRMEQMEFTSREEAMSWIITNQFARRNLDAVQRSRLALKRKEIIAQIALNRKIQSGGDKKSPDARSVLMKSSKPIFSEPINTRKQLAEIAGVSEDTIRKVEIIDTSAPKPVIKAMEDNVISINKAYELTKAAIAQPEFKQHLESSVPASISQITVKDLQLEKERLDKEYKRQSQIMNYWSIMNTLTYNDFDYQAWLSDLTEDGIENQLRTVDSGVEKAKVIQKRLHEICKERRRLKLIK